MVKTEKLGDRTRGKTGIKMQSQRKRQVRNRCIKASE